MSCFDCAYLKISGTRFVNDALCTHPAVQISLYVDGEGPYLPSLGGCSMEAEEKQAKPWKKPKLLEEHMLRRQGKLEEAQIGLFGAEETAPKSTHGAGISAIAL